MGIFAVVVIILLVVFVVYRIYFVEKKEEGNAISRYLVCTKIDLRNYVLLEGSEYGNTNYEARVMYINDTIHDMNFTVSQHFSNEQSTRVFTDKLLAEYNIYTGKNDIARSNITTTFTNVDNIGKMVLAIKGAVLNNKIAPLVMLDSADKNMTLGDMQNQYERKKFSCSVSEEDMVLSD